MPEFNPTTLELIVYIGTGVLLLFFGFQAGRLIARMGYSTQIKEKEQELFTAQKGFKNLYEQELSNINAEKEQLIQQVQALTTRVEEYRKKAAGFGGLFNSSSKKSDAMYALLLENEALEEALYSQNEKLKQERSDSLKEQMRATSYRRVLMSQLLNDERIKDYVAEIMNDEKRLPDATPTQSRAALPSAQVTPESAG